MRRSKHHRSDQFLGNEHQYGKRWPTLRLVASAIAAISTIMLVFFGGEYVQRYLTYKQERQPGPVPSKPIPTAALRHIALHTIYELPRPSEVEKLLQSGLPIYDLRIGRNNLKLLQQTAEVVLAKGFSTGVQRDYVPAEFRSDSDWRPVKVKLRGLTAYHYLKKRPSLRLRFPKEHYFHGRREINLSEPYDKGLTADLTTNWVLERQGILTWDSRFIILRVNDEVIGLFQEIEQFGKSIPARNHRSEGYIFSGGGQLFGSEGINFDKATRAINLVGQCFADELGQVRSHCTDFDWVSDYFDLDRWAWAAAVSTLLKSRHAWAPDNLRLFWDPARGKFEPIPWDYLCYALDPEIDLDGEADYTGYLSESLLAIPEFRAMRDLRLWSLLDPGVERMIGHANDLFTNLTFALSHDVRHLSLNYDIEKQAKYVATLRNNRDFLTALYQKHDLEAGYWQNDVDRLTVEMRNGGKSFVEVDTLLLDANGEQTPWILERPVTVNGAWLGSKGSALLEVQVPVGAQLAGLSARNGVTGATLSQTDITVRRLSTKPVYDPQREPITPFVMTQANVEVGDSEVAFGPGAVRLEGTVEIPSSFDVVFRPGLDLEMERNSVLLVYGNLKSVGTRAAPIRISGRSLDSRWGGILVQGTRTEPARVHLRHTIVEGGTGGQSERIRFSSPFSVHDGRVVIESSEFHDTEAEDGLNLKNVSVRLENSLLTGSRSDALDCDFCTGRVINNRFVDVGGDAIDFSGSRVEVAGNQIESCADKGLSVGEQTAAYVTDMRIANCYTGIAVKDLSSVTIRNVGLEDLQVGLSLYVKKPTFGPSSASVSELSMNRVASEFLTESTCRLAAL
jgi:hypothetical protein